MSRFRRIQAVVALACAVVFAVAWPRAARAEAVALATTRKVVDLYTIGQGSYLYAARGHTLLCVRDASAKPPVGQALTGTCYDYGVAAADGTLAVMWASVRARPVFVALAVEEATVVGFFEDQGRSIERQTLPLAPAEAEQLATRLAHDARSRWSYAYHPYFANCATQLRDRIDSATGGRLRAGVAGRRDSYRELMEQGLSGHLLELMGLSLLLGAPNERVPDPWQTMFLPETLRDAVTVHLDAPPVQVAERVAVVLPTSSSIGRLGLLLLGVLLAVAVRASERFRHPRRGLVGVAIVLGGLGFLVAFVAAVSTWPELSRNANLLLVWPTDLALPLLSPLWRRRYARLRVGASLVVGALEVFSVVTQPVLTTVALVVLPMLAIAKLAGARADASKTTQGTAAQPTTESARAA